jgi:hypothetical protein
MLSATICDQARHKDYLFADRRSLALSSPRGTGCSCVASRSCKVVSSHTRVVFDDCIGMDVSVATDLADCRDRFVFRRGSENDLGFRISGLARLL